MLRLLLVATVIAFALPAAVPASAAVTQCRDTPAKTCPGPKKPAPKKAAKAKSAPPKAARPGKPRSAYTADQRKQMMDRAREICRKEVGASSTVYRIDYKKNRVICWRPGA